MKKCFLCIGTSAKLLCESQKQIGWGNNALEQLANDLKNDYPKVKGFFPTKLQVYDSVS